MSYSQVDNETFFKDLEEIRAGYTSDQKKLLHIGGAAFEASLLWALRTSEECKAEALEQSHDTAAYYHHARLAEKYMAFESYLESTL
jgi:hypothetical protein